MATDQVYFGGPGALDKPSERKWGGMFSFVQMADTQLGLYEGFKKSGWGAEDMRPDIKDAAAAYELEKQLSVAAVNVINAMAPAPKFAVICGDLVNAFPAAKEDDDGSQQEAQVQDLKGILEKIRADVPLICVCGNHDVGERPNAITLGKWKERFGPDYFSFWAGGCKFIVINSQLYKDAQDAPEEAAAQDAWLTTELSAEDTASAAHVIVLSHIPPFIERPDEPSGYFPLSLEVRTDLLQRFSDAGVTYWFCGHYHRNAGGVFVPPNKTGKTVQVVTTAAVGTNLMTKEGADVLSTEGIGGFTLGPDVSGFRVVSVNEESLNHEFKTLGELAAQYGSDLGGCGPPKKD